MGIIRLAKNLQIIYFGTLIIALILIFVVLEYNFHI